jgi:hypothetical protein
MRRTPLLSKIQDGHGRFLQNRRPPHRHGWGNYELLRPLSRSAGLVTLSESLAAQTTIFSPVPSCTGENFFFGRVCSCTTPNGSSCPRTPRPPRTASQGLSLNRSQYGGCSTKHNTPAGIQVVCRRFGGEQAVFPESSVKSELTPEQ